MAAREQLELRSPLISVAAGLPRIVPRLAALLSAARNCPRALPTASAASTTPSLNKYYVDELYAVLFVKPLIEGSTSNPLARRGPGRDRCQRRTTPPTRRAHVSDDVRHMQSGNLRSYAGWVAAGARRGDRLHGLDGGCDEHGEPQLHHSVAGDVSSRWRVALLLLLIPRRDRDIKLFALVISLLAFVVSLHLPVHLHRAPGRLPVRNRQSLDRHAQHSLPHGHRRNLRLAGRADHVPHAAVRADFLDFDSRAGEGILHPAADPGDGADRRVHRARPVPVLLLLGSDADSRWRC